MSREIAYQMPLYMSGLPDVKEWRSRDQARLSEGLVVYLKGLSVENETTFGVTYHRYDETKSCYVVRS